MLQFNCFKTFPLVGNMQSLHGLACYERFKRLITRIPNNLTDEKIDRIQEEWTAYKVAIDIKEEWFIKLETKTEVKNHRAGTYLIKVVYLKTPSENPRCPEVSSYLPSLLALANGNSDVEGFLC